MRHIFLTTLIGAALLTIFAQCQSDPFLPKEEIDALISSQFPRVSNVAFIDNNEVYVTNHLRDSLPVKINAPEGFKKSIRISHDGNKLAYLDENGSPVIIDRQGNLLDKLSQYSRVVNMDWTTDDETLYIFVDDEMKYYGKTPEAAEIIYPSHVAYSVYHDHITAALSPSLDVAYVINREVYSFGRFYYIHHLFIRHPDGSFSDFELELPQNKKVKTLEYTSDGELVIGINSDILHYSANEVDVYDEEAMTAEGELMDSFRGQEFKSPNYAKESQYLVTIVDEKLTAINSEDPKKTFILEGFTPSSVDCK